MDIMSYEYLEAISDSYFSWNGCENPNCAAHNIGATVFDCIAYRTAHELGDSSEIEIVLCEKCLIDHFYWGLADPVRPPSKLSPQQQKPKQPNKKYTFTVRRKKIV